MDDMYRTVHVACKMAKRAHNKEKRVHVIFKEMGLFRIKPVEEISKINQQRIYGWTVPSWKPDVHGELTWAEVKKQYPMGDDCFVRKQFYKEDCYYDPSHVGLNLYNRYTQQEIERCLLCGQGL